MTGQNPAPVVFLCVAPAVRGARYASPNFPACCFHATAAELASADGIYNTTHVGRHIEGDRERALGILDGVSKGIQERYYDPKMNGLDWNVVLSPSRAKIAASNSLNEALTQIAVAVGALHDSHTRFRRPARPYHLDFGFEHQMIWSLCFVTRVQPGSDAEPKGLKRPEPKS